MQCSKNKLLVCACGVLVVLASLIWIKIESSKDVRVGLERKIFPPNVHSSAVPWIEIRGKTYKNLKGERPYYLDVGDSGIVYFFSDYRGSASFHLVSKNGKIDLELPYNGYYDGRGIGARIESPNYDWVDSVDLPKIVIKSRSSLGDENVLRTLVFDVSNCSVVEDSRFTPKQ